MYRRIEEEEKEYMREIGQRIRWHRLNAGFCTREEFAERIGVSSNAYKNYETGQARIPLMRLQLIADALSLTLDELIGNEPKHAVHSFYDARQYLATLYADYATKTRNEKVTDEDTQQAAWRFCMYAEAFAWIFGMTPEAMSEQAQGRAKVRKLV